MQIEREKQNTLQWVTKAPNKEVQKLGLFLGAVAVGLILVSLVE